jgi:hypothetical protein
LDAGRLLICARLLGLPVTGARLAVRAGGLGEYEVSYAIGEPAEPEALPSRSHTIYYSELAAIPTSAESLLENPFLLLKKPDRGGLTDVMGPDIFAQITLHLVRVAKGEISPLVGYSKDAHSAFKKIKDRNPKAVSDLKQLLV